MWSTWPSSLLTTTSFSCTELGPIRKCVILSKNLPDLETDFDHSGGFESLALAQNYYSMSRLGNPSPSVPVVHNENNMMCPLYTILVEFTTNVTLRAIVSVYITTLLDTAMTTRGSLPSKKLWSSIVLLAS